MADQLEPTWQRDPIGPIRTAAAETVAGRNRDAGIQRMTAEHGANLPAWWKADPSGNRDLDLTQFYEVTGRCAEILLPRLDEATAIRARSESVLMINPITDLDRVCMPGSPRRCQSRSCSSIFRIVRARACR